MDCQYAQSLFSRAVIPSRFPPLREPVQSQGALCLAPELKQPYMTKSPQEMIHKLARFPIVGQWTH
jgi:hypothetical protein